MIEPKGAASGRHGAAQRRLAGYVGPFDRRPGGRAPGGWWFATEVDVYFDPHNTFRPDVVGWRRDRVPVQPEDPDQGTLTVYRWTPDAYLEILIAERGEEVRAEPFEELPLRVGVLFGDEDEASADSGPEEPRSK